MASLLAIPGLLTEMGVDPRRVIAEAGLDPALFDDPENTIPFTDLGRFVELCVARTGCPYLGLRVGETMSPEVLGLVGKLASCASDVGSALRNIVKYLHLHDRGALPALWVNGDRATLAYVIHEPDVLATEQIYDAALAHAHNILKVLAGPRWKASEVCLSRPRPAQIEPYQHFFRTRLRFDADHNAVVFSASWLNCPIDGADAPSHRALMQLIEALDAPDAGDLVAQLRQALRKLLVGDVDEGKISLEEVSQQFAIHRRTLNRRLRAQGTSFKNLLDEARYDIARQRLRDTHLPVLKIAVTLGYADATAFTRAFRRWSGTSPAVWRSAHQRF
ncbi:MAG: AraC family transcriptional regulator [Pseudomonadota bacterium]|nr:AraC family transcriptional regulator [Pseudomonadota bacterium]